MAAFAVAGWIWALSSDDMPDALWLLTVLLSIAAVGLAVYALILGRRRACERAALLTEGREPYRG